VRQARAVCVQYSNAHQGMKAISIKYGYHQNPIEEFKKEKGKRCASHAPFALFPFFFSLLLFFFFSLLLFFFTSLFLYFSFSFFLFSCFTVILL
jgi:hypothetical protein